MGRLAAALGLVLVGACATDPSGLTLDIFTDDPAIVSVELFMGKDCGELCAGQIAPPTMGRMDAAGFLTDDTERCYCGLNAACTPGQTCAPRTFGPATDPSPDPCGSICCGNGTPCPL